MKIKRNNDLPYVFGNAVIILMIIVTIISILIVSQEYWKPVFFLRSSLRLGNNNSTLIKRSNSAPLFIEKFRCLSIFLPGRER
jgi:hypothetical protein